MKQKMLFIVLSFLMILCVENVSASCSYQIRDEAARVESSVDMKQFVVDYDGIKHPELTEEDANDDSKPYTFGDFISLKLVNITPDIYFTIENKTEGVKETYTYDDLENGAYEYEAPDNDIIREFEIKIYSNNPECQDEELRTMTAKLPRYNEFSEMEGCQGSNEYYCKEYIDNELVLTADEILERFKVDEEIAEEESSQTNVVTKNIIWISLSVIAIVAAVAVFVIFKRRKKGKLQ